MPSAIYYPHTVIRNPNLINTSLLLWDNVICIVPQNNWITPHDFKEKAFNEALDIITKYHVPSLQEKKSANKDITEFLLEDESRFLLETTLLSVLLQTEMDKRPSRVR